MYAFILYILHIIYTFIIYRNITYYIYILYKSISLFIPSHTYPSCVFEGYIHLSFSEDPADRACTMLKLHFTMSEIKKKSSNKFQENTVFYI